MNSSKYSNAFDPYTGQIDRKRSDTNWLKTTGISVSLGKQLKWPDDYFTMVYSLNYTQYKLINYPLFVSSFDSGVSNNVNIKFALSRNSAGPNPMYPTMGSNFLVSAQFTPLMIFGKLI